MTINLAKRFFFMNIMRFYLNSIFYSKRKKNEATFRPKRYIRTISLNETPTFFDLVQQGIIEGKYEARVVFFRIAKDSGYGNRLYSMLSALLVAVVTDSALLIDWPSIDAYIGCPLIGALKSFNDKSFLDFEQNSPKICKIETSTSNTLIQDILIFNC